MRSFWSDPYLWIHLAGVAALPIFLEVCFLGLAVGDPVLPLGLELLLVAAVGIVPVLWMQWQRPFYIFSLMAIALKPEQLTVERRKLLRLFKAPIHRMLAVGAPIFLFWVLWQLYRYAPIASDITPLPTGARSLGLLLAAIAFLASNLFLQVPVSVASVLFTRETTFAATEPYPVEQISTDFTLLGWRVKRILPNVIPDVIPDIVAANPAKPMQTQAKTQLSSIASSPIADLAEPDQPIDQPTVQPLANKPDEITAEDEVFESLADEAIALSVESEHTNLEPEQGNPTNLVGGAIEIEAEITETTKPTTDEP